MKGIKYSMNKVDNNRKVTWSKKKLAVSGLLLIISAGLFGMSRYVSGFANIYYENIYLNLVNVIGRGLSIIKVSVYELIVIGFILFIFIKLIMYIYLKYKKRISLKEIIIRATANIILYISIFIFLNAVTLGVNAFRPSFAKLTDLKNKDVSEENLTELCSYLKDKLNESDNKIQKDQYGLLKLDDSVKEEGINSMKNLGDKYSCLQGYYPLPKPYLFSKVMSYQLLEGETDFTLEANYNNDMPKVDVPSTICHELSHVRGFNNEDEANYIGFLACINSNNYEYQYSGYLMAYSYCMNDLYDSNKEAFKKINNEISINVKAELKNDALYWNKYRGRISKIHNDAYDKLLKISGQENGIKSYNAVVKLLVSGYGVQFK